MEECRHPRVRTLPCDEDAEFVECEVCGEVFDPHEYNDMAIEERVQQGVTDESDPQSDF